MHGALLAVLFWSGVEMNSERRMIDSLKIKILHATTAPGNVDSVFIAAMRLTYNLLEPRVSANFSRNFLPDLPESFCDRLTTAPVSCSSYAQVLARILQGFGYPVRIGQMKANGHFGAHIITEAYDGKRWVILDACYGLVFRNAREELAGFEEIQRNWDGFKRQVPANYNFAYRYEDIRYTNWGKIPVMMPATKWVLDKIYGKKEADLICLRTKILSIYKVYLILIMVLESGLILMHIHISYKKNRRNHLVGFNVTPGVHI